MGDINAQYAELYKADEPLTGESRTYFSRSAEGDVLYPTHHFTEEELNYLFTGEGLDVVKLIKDREASSRRPDQAAWFLYAVAGRNGQHPDGHVLVNGSSLSAKRICTASS